jgi:hypothetical protein
MKEDLLICQCGDPAHQLILFYDDDIEIPAVYLTVHLSPERNFFKRLWRGIKYIFANKRSIYGDFDEIILKPEDAGKLQNAVDYLNTLNEFNELIDNEGVIPIYITENKYKS